MRFSFLFLMFAACSPPVANVKKAEHYAKLHGEMQWADKLKNVQCEKVDSDTPQNGRVRCNLFSASGDVSVIECPSNWLPQFESMCVPVDTIRVKR